MREVYTVAFSDRDNEWVATVDLPEYHFCSSLDADPVVALSGLREVMRTWEEYKAEQAAQVS